MSFLHQNYFCNKNTLPLSIGLCLCLPVLVCVYICVRPSVHARTTEKERKKGKQQVGLGPQVIGRSPFDISHVTWQTDVEPCPHMAYPILCKLLCLPLWRRVVVGSGRGKKPNPVFTHPPVHFFTPAVVRGSGVRLQDRRVTSHALHQVTWWLPQQQEAGVKKCGPSPQGAQLLVPGPSGLAYRVEKVHQGTYKNRHHNQRDVCLVLARMYLQSGYLTRVN